MAETQQSVQALKEKHNLATLTYVVSLFYLLDLIRISGLQNKIFAQLWMQAGPSGGLGAFAAKPVAEGWDLSIKSQQHSLNVFKMFDAQTQNRSKDCNEAQHGGSTTICTIAETESQACNTDGCRKL